MDYIVHGVAESRTQLSNFHFTSLLRQLSFHSKQYNSVLYTGRTEVLSVMGVNISSEITSHFESTLFPNTQPRLITAYEGRLQKHYPKNSRYIEC